jgi:hypothetical protein
VGRCLTSQQASTPTRTGVDAGTTAYFQLRCAAASASRGPRGANRIAGWGKKNKGGGGFGRKRSGWVARRHLCLSPSPCQCPHTPCSSQRTPPLPTQRTLSRVNNSRAHSEKGVMEPTPLLAPSRDPCTAQFLGEQANVPQHSPMPLSMCRDDTRCCCCAFPTRQREPNNTCTHNNYLLVLETSPPPPQKKKKPLCVPRGA